MSNTDTLTLDDLSALFTTEKKERKNRTVLHTAPIIRRFVTSGEVYRIVPKSLYPEADTVAQIVKAFEHQINATDYDVEFASDTLRIDGAGDNIKVGTTADNDILLVNVPLFEAQKNGGKK